MEYIKIDQDDCFELCKKATLYKCIITQGLVYNKITNECLGHNAEFYYKQNGEVPDISVYEIRFKDGKREQID